MIQLTESRLESKCTNQLSICFYLHYLLGLGLALMNIKNNPALPRSRNSIELHPLHKIPPYAGGGEKLPSSSSRAKAVLLNLFENIDAYSVIR